MSNRSVDDRVVILEANSFIRIKTFDLPKHVQFAIFQAHSQIRSVTLADEEELVPGNHVNGSSIGLYSDMSGSRSEATAFLINPHPFNVTVLTFIMFYNKYGE